MFLKKNQSFKLSAKNSCEHLPPTEKNNINTNYFRKRREWRTETPVGEVTTSLENESTSLQCRLLLRSHFTPELGVEGDGKAGSANRWS